jgi:hypothetical protein|tara:strand:+ start:5610 stop:5750 length:141 start_codon:yes stop_codon:yes gene_type:complete
MFKGGMPIPIVSFGFVAFFLKCFIKIKKKNIALFVILQLILALIEF